MLPYQKHSATSLNAAHVASRTAGAARYKVYAYIHANPGASDEDIARGLEMNPNTSRPRRVELESYGLIRQVGIKSTQASGTPAVTYSVVEGVPYPAKFPVGTRVSKSEKPEGGLAFLGQVSEIAEALRTQEVSNQMARENLWSAFLEYTGLTDSE